MLTMNPPVAAPIDNEWVEVDRLITGLVHWFSDWPTGDVPRSGAVVYTIWNREGDLIPGNWTGRSDDFPVISPGWEKGTGHEGVQVFGAADCRPAQAGR
jgi:hypothetical protein